MIGTMLAHYEITSHLGSGGMGEVYEATDTKLGRGVAIKLLPAAVASDGERLSRFVREAQVLASLNHPNIAQVYGIEEAGETRCIVMELIQGETLQARVERGPIPVNEALGVARQIAQALEAAHAKGIVHRDLKPGNVMLTGDGKVKVLDFGLAKAYEGNSAAAHLSNSPTIASLAGTNVGVILGTAAYMSPEQAKGRAVDRRTDIFAFGCVLYEMLTGKRTFDGDDVTDILSAVVRLEPDWKQLPDGLPASLRHLLRLCLEKNPNNRRSDATDVRLDLDHILQEIAAPASKPIEAAKPPLLWSRVIPIALALLLVGFIAGAAVWKLRPAAPLLVTRFTVTLPQGQTFTATGRPVVAISPDGTQIVYVANQRLYRRALSELEAHPIPGTEIWQNVANPVFSPDGQSLAFFAVSDLTLKKIAVSGGAAITLCPVTAGIGGMSWGENGIVFVTGSPGIQRVSENGGKPELLAAVGNGEFVARPQILPGEDALLYSVATNGEWDKAKIYVQSIKPGSARKQIIDGGTDARYVPTGHIVYAYQGTLFAVPFDLKRLQVTGGTVPVVEGVRRATNNATAQFSFSNTGSLIYIPGPANASGGADRVLAMLDTKTGALERLKMPAKAYAFARLSPNGKQLAVSTDDKDTNIWIVDLAAGTAPRQLTLGGANRYPLWSADGKWVAFQSDREGDLGIWWQKADGTGTAGRLTKAGQGLAHIPDSWSPDGKNLSYTAVKGASEGAVWILSVSDKQAVVFAEKAGALIGRSAFSPDGQWLAYQSSETAITSTSGGAPFTVFVQPFPATGAKYPIARGGQPFWSRDGRRLIYNPAAGQIAEVGIVTKPSFSFSEPTIKGLAGLQSKNPATDPRVWDVAPDGERVLGVTDSSNGDPSAATAAPQIQVVLNWFTDLQQHVK
jgi:serine/threonine-protein kinase